MNKEYKNIENKKEEKSMEQMVQQIKMNYAIMLLLKFGKSES